MNRCSYWLRDVIAYGPYAWTVLGNMSERDHEFQLKYSIIEFFLTLPSCTLASETSDSQRHQCVYFL